MSTKTVSHASESGHFYDRDGNQIDTIDGKVPDFRNKLVRKHNLAPGVTSCMQMKASPALMVYAVDQALDAALTDPGTREGETGAQWKKRVKEQADQHRNDAASEGTAIHAAIEQHYRGESFDPRLAKHVESVRTLLDNIAPGEVWLPEKSVISPLGVGSKIDLHSDKWIIDFKGCEKPVEKLELYDNHWMQLGFYDHIKPGRRCAIVFVHRTQGWAHAIEATREQLDMGFALLRCCIKMWQITKKYRPEWATMEP